MPSSAGRWVFGLLFLGVLFIGFSFYWGLRQESHKSLEPLATLQKEAGKVTLFKEGLVTKDKVDHRSFVYDLDSIETNEVGLILLSFSQGAVVKVFPNSLVTLHHIQNPSGNSVELILKRGDLKVESSSAQPYLWIVKNGQKVLDEEFNQSQLREQTTQAPVVTSSNEGISNDEVVKVMESQRSVFFKCFSQLLQKSPQVKGVVQMQFVIENNGKLSGLKLESTELQDPIFLSCLKEALRRVEFRSYQGTPISAVFPLQFE